MSGTSADGVDAALVRLRDRRAAGRTTVEVSLLGFETTPYASSIRDQILSAANGDVRDLVDLDHALGRMFADAARAVVEAAGSRVEDVDFVGSHGQTVFHRPPTGVRSGVTLQIGCAEEIAARLGCPVVSGFRVRDVVLGGHGAPLVPRADELMFAHESERRVLLNIGGIANLTALTADPSETRAFDTGPGNALLDSLVRAATAGQESYDDGGARALAGTPVPSLLADLLAHPFLAQAPPRSADRSVFGEPLARRLLAEHPEVALEDLLATAAWFTADSAAAAILALGPPFGSIDRVIVSGGGVHNAAVMRRLAARLAPAVVESSAVHGLDPDAKEAVAFALLARETLLGRPGNLPGVTGASAAAVLGHVTP